MRVGVVASAPRVGDALRAGLVRAGDSAAWVAYDGASGLADVARDPPDALIVDLALRDVDPVAFIEQALRVRSAPILVVSSDGPDVDRAYRAMSSGAADAADIPSGARWDEAPHDRALAQKLARLRALAGPTSRSTATAAARPFLVLVGASTGGPAALADVLRAFSPSTPAAIVLVQHVDARFTTGLASFLERDRGVAVELATDRARPRAGVAYLAATEDHLVLTPGGAFATTAEPRDTPHRPSVDVLFKSAAAHWPDRGAAALLTGMGRDGAAGLKALRDKGWTTIAQDEATSTVYGMPKAAVELGAAEQVLGLPLVGPALERASRRRTAGAQ